MPIEDERIHEGDLDELGKVVQFIDGGLFGNDKAVLDNGTVWCKQTLHSRLRYPHFFTAWVRQ